MYGYAGKILFVDLGKEKIVVKKLERARAKKYLGGVGLAASFIWEMTDAGTDPLSTENPLIFVTGPVNGTGFPPTGRFAVCSISPLTGIWGESHAGGFFGPQIKYTGFDAIVVTGRSNEKVYLALDGGKAELRSARNLWGLDVLETTDRIREEMPGSEVACIGPAGENLVKFASIQVCKYRAAGRTGMGAVMGSKNLKAVAARGVGEIEVYDVDKFVDLVEEARRRYTEERWGIAAQESLGKYGTTSLVEAEQEIGRLPTKNHTTGIFRDFDKIGGEAVRKLVRKKRKACMGCAIQCKYVAMIDSGEFAGTITEGPEYETLVAFGSDELNSRLDSIVYANYLCNKLGLDTISTGKSIAFAMELSEKGLISQSIKWGDVEAMVKLVSDIAYRRGFGNELAEGVRNLAAKLGPEAEKLAVHVKGLEMSGQDGRAHKSIGLTHAISVRGADHLRSISCLDELGYVDIAKERYPEDAKVILDLRSEKLKGILVADMETNYAIVDSLIICKYGTMWPPIFYYPDYARLIYYTTGFEEYQKPENVQTLGDRICMLRRAINARRGITRKDDTLPYKQLHEPMPEGPAKGEVVHLDVMLDEFYDARGCTRDGKPRYRRLKELGLKQVGDELAKANIISSEN
ncbi:MAG: aldehyde ferredoxin oxidoreductase family protein [Thermoplasmata archaeon]|nr:aldehyde ferredoxin oxidoreductase family protein [Thermoplasmata archaeon]